MAHNFIDAPDDVIAAEKEYIRHDREAAGSGDENQHRNDFSGLSLSGGGIRSASFCLGVIQALVSAGMLKKIDYLSTASGGGYIGSALTWFLNQGLPDGQPAGTDADNFPLGHARTGARNQKRNPNAVLDFLRQHGCYLTPDNNLDAISLLGYAIRTVLVSFVVYFSMMLLLLTLLELVGAFQSPAELLIAPLQFLPNWLFLIVLAIGALFVAVSLSYSLLTRLRWNNSSFRYQTRVYHQILLGLLLKHGAVLAVLGSLSVTYNLLKQSDILAIGTASSSTLLGTLMGWLQYRRERRKTDDGMPKGSSLHSIVAAILIIYGLLLGAYIVTETINNLSGLVYVGVLSATLITAVVLGLAVNVNYAGLHRMYRDRLMEAFMPDAESINHSRWGFSETADTALLETMCQSPNRRPYHLINTNMVLADSDTAKYRGRGGDNFILSPMYCGSDATGWRKSSTYMKSGARGITLATAMAVSGAAVNPNAANSGRGTGRNRWVSILHSLLNLRLGYWAINPKVETKRSFVPNFIWPALTQGILFKGLKEDKRVIELTDGGHFENLAVYELIRRKLKVVICCDGGADPRFTFDDLGNLIEKVRVDFGVKIIFDNPDLDLPDLLPGSSDNPTVAAKYHTAKRGFAVATIHYNDGSQGTLIYVKATMVEGLSTDIYSYKSACPTFPHQPTLDQFFGEVQIEAYRELGYYLGWQMLEANAGVASGQVTDPTKPGQWI